MPARPARNAGATGTTYGPATIRKTARHRCTRSGKTATDSSACPRLSMSAAIHQQLPDTLDLHALRLAPSVDVRRSLQARPRTARQRSHFTRREPSFGDRVVPFSYVHSSDRFGCVRCGSSCASVTNRMPVITFLTDSTAPAVRDTECRKYAFGQIRVRECRASRCLAQ